MLKDMKGHEMNVFFNLEENILNELIEYAAKSEHVEEGKRLEFIEEIKWWKKRLEINENDLKQNLWAVFIVVGGFDKKKILSSVIKDFSWMIFM